MISSPMKAILLIGLLLCVWMVQCVQAKFDPKDPRVEDRLALMDLMTRYCTSIDTRNSILYKSVFTKDAVLDYSANSFVGKGGPDKMWKEISEGLSIFSVTAHQWTNMDVDFAGPREAKMRVMLNNPLYLYGFPVFPFMTVHAYYNHVLVKDAVDDQWRSKEMFMEVDIQGHYQVIASIAIIILLYRTRRVHLNK